MFVKAEPWEWVRVTLAMLLASSAILKFDSVENVATSGFLVATVLIGFETTLALWLVSRLWTQVAWGVTLATFVAFSVTASTRGLLGYESCGCFGSVAVNPWLMFLVDCMAVLALLVFRPGAGIRTCLGDRRVTWALLVVSVTLPAVLAGAVAHEVSGATALRMRDLVEGEKCPLLPHVDIRDHIGTGDWLVVLYRDDCAKCGELLDRMRTEPLVRQAAPIALVAVSSKAATSAHGLPVLPNVVSGRVSREIQWRGVVPLALTLRDGRMLGVDESPQFTLFRSLVDEGMRYE